MTNSVTNLAYLLKSVYEDNDLLEQFAKNTVLRQVFKTDSRWVTKLSAAQGNSTNTPAAYGMIWPIEDTRNNSVGMYSLSSPTLLPPTTRQGAQAFVNLAGSSLGVIFDSILFTAATGGDESFGNVVSRQMKTTFEDFDNFESRVMWGNGNGVLGTVGAINTGTGVVTLTQASGSFYPLTLFLSAGQYVTFLSPTGTDRSMSGVLISATSDVNGTITIPTGGNIANIAVGDVIVGWQSWVGGASAGVEPIGLNGMFANNNNLFNITVSAHPKWVPATIVTNNTDPTEAFIEQLRMNIVTAGAKPKMAITHPFVVSKYGTSLYTYKRYMNTTKIMGGAETYEEAQTPQGPEYPGVGPVVADANTPTGPQSNTFQMWMGDNESIFVGESAPIHWMDQDEAILKFVIGGASATSQSQAQYVGYLEHIWQLGCFRRKSNAFATNVNSLVVA